MMCVDVVVERAKIDHSAIITPSMSLNTTPRVSLTPNANAAMAALAARDKHNEM